MYVSVYMFVYKELPHRDIPAWHFPVGVVPRNPKLNIIFRYRWRVLVPLQKGSAAMDSQGQPREIDVAVKKPRWGGGGERSFIYMNTHMLSRGIILKALLCRQSSAEKVNRRIAARKVAYWTCFPRGKCAEKEKITAGIYI